MKISLVYTHVVGKSDPNAPDPSYYAKFEERFLETLNAYSSPLDTALHVVCCGDGAVDACASLVRQADVLHFYNGGGWDIGAYQKACKELDCDLAVFFATPCYFWKHGWLDRLVEAFSRFGPGLYGPMASFEHQPHIRTGCFACPPTLLNSYPQLIDTREKCRFFETTEWNFTRWVMDRGFPCKMVTWDEFLDVQDWRNRPNIFRRGDQTACPVWDRHVDVWNKASLEEKDRLTKAADGL